jgi:two-component system response regulator AtoC
MELVILTLTGCRPGPLRGQQPKKPPALPEDPYSSENELELKLAPSHPKVLVVSEESATLSALVKFLSAASFDPIVARGEEVIERLSRELTLDTLFLDLEANGHGDSLQLLGKVRRIRPHLKIIVLSSGGNVRPLVEAVRLGAKDYALKPLQEAEVRLALSRCLNAKDSSVGPPADEHGEELADGSFFVAASPLMQKIRLQAELLANFDVPVLILGESGTGKEVMARLIHKLSSRASARFLKVNCSAFPADLLESELFGYEAGAFTGATRTRLGKFELCNGGTILLDEIGEMPTPLQPKLLHVLQDKQFFRLGGEATVRVDVRILAATNVDVHTAIADKRLREDLYYRLSAFTIQLPPLRDRADEIPTFLNHFIYHTAKTYGRERLQISPLLLEACLRYPWPGNLRQMENFVKRYLVMEDEAMAMRELELPHDRDSAPGNGQSGNGKHELPMNFKPGNGKSESLTSMVRNVKDEAEVKAITQVLEETNWNRRAAAEALNISYRGLLYKIQQHNIVRAVTARSMKHLSAQPRDVGNRNSTASVPRTGNL